MILYSHVIERGGGKEISLCDIVGVVAVEAVGNRNLDALVAVHGG